jgi:endonuclease VIII
MAEGDTIYRMAAGLRPQLVGRIVRSARTTKNAGVGRLVGSTVISIETLGKNLLIRFSNGLTLRTHLRMTGTWRTYESGEAGRRAAARAVLVVELDGVLAACFDAPVVELFDTRAESIHPVLRRLGPDLLDEAFDAAGALVRLRDPAESTTTIAEAILDQRVMAGVGNVFRSEILFIERVDPFAVVGSLDDRTLERIVATAQRLLLVNVQPGHPRRRITTDRVRAAGSQDVWVYGLAGRPCRRCGTSIRAASLGRDLPRTVWWCPRCQAPAADRGTDEPALRPRTRPFPRS